MEIKEQDLIDEVLDALEYYSDEKTYYGQSYGGAYGGVVAPIEHDEGKRARAVLEKIRARVKDAIKKSFLSG